MLSLNLHEKLKIENIKELTIQQSVKQASASEKLKLQERMINQQQNVETVQPVSPRSMQPVVSPRASPRSLTPRAHNFVNLTPRSKEQQEEQKWKQSQHPGIVSQEPTDSENVALEAEVIDGDSIEITTITDDEE